MKQLPVDPHVSLLQYLVTCYIGQVIEQNVGDKLTLVNCNISKKLRRLFIILSSVVWAKRYGVSLFIVVFGLTENGRLLLFHVFTLE
jgi:hypothetical protein